LRRSKGGPWDPVAIWKDRDVLKATRASKPCDPYAIWTWACRNPVSEEEWRKVDKGGEWSDAAPPAPVAGHNLPEDPAERFALMLAEERALWTDWLGEGPVADEDRAAAAATLIKRWSSSETEAEALRVAEKKPHDEAARAVQQKWAPVVKGFADLKVAGKRALDDFLRAKAKAAAEEARQAALAAAADAAAPVEVEKPRVGNTGEAVSLRTYYTAVITDMAVFLEGQKEHPDIVAAAQKIANAIARGKAAVPGMKIVTEQRAA
jgi:hypothetical protein